MNTAHYNRCANLPTLSTIYFDYKHCGIIIVVVVVVAVAADTTTF